MSVFLAAPTDLAEDHEGLGAKSVLVESISSMCRGRGDTKNFPLVLFFHAGGQAAGWPSALTLHYSPICILWEMRVFLGHEKVMTSSSCWIFLHM